MRVLVPDDRGRVAAVDGAETVAVEQEQLHPRLPALGQRRHVRVVEVGVVGAGRGAVVGLDLHGVDAREAVELDVSVVREVVVEAVDEVEGLHAVLRAVVDPRGDERRVPRALRLGGVGTARVSRVLEREHEVVVHRAVDLLCARERVVVVEVRVHTRVRAVEHGRAGSEPLPVLEVDRHLGAERRVAGEDLGGGRVLHQVLAEEHGAAGRVDDRVVVRGIARAVGQVPREPRPAAAAEQHQAGEVAALELGRAAHAGRPRRHPDGPRRADVALERAHGLDGVEPRRRRGDLRGRRPGRAEDAAAAVEADAHAAVEGRDPAVGLPEPQVREAGPARGRARRQLEIVDAVRGEAEQRPVRAHPVERHVGAIARGRARERSVDGLHAAQPRLGRRDCGQGEQRAGDERRNACHPPTRGASLVCLIRPRDRQG